MASYFHSRQNLALRWSYCDMIFSFLTIYMLLFFGGVGVGVGVEWGGWLWGWGWGLGWVAMGVGVGHYIMISYFHSWQHLMEVIMLCHYIFIPDNIRSGSDYIVPLHFHSRHSLVWGRLYRHFIFTPVKVQFGGDQAATYFTPLDCGTGRDYVWLSSILTFDITEWRYQSFINVFICRYVHIHRMKLGGTNHYI